MSQCLKNASVFCFHFLLSRHIICQLWSEIYSKAFFKIKPKCITIFIQVAWDCLLLYLEDISAQLSYINISYMIDFRNRKKRLYSNNCYCLNGKKKKSMKVKWTRDFVWVAVNTTEELWILKGQQIN